MRRLFWLLAGAMMMAAPAAAQDLVDAGWGVVTEVTDGDTLVLEQGLVVRLAGIQSPKLPLGRAGFEQQPLTPEASGVGRPDVGQARKAVVRWPADRLLRPGVGPPSCGWRPVGSGRNGAPGFGPGVKLPRQPNDGRGICWKSKFKPAPPSVEFGHWRFMGFAKRNKPVISSTDLSSLRVGFRRQNRSEGGFT